MNTRSQLPARDLFTRVLSGFMELNNLSHKKLARETVGSVRNRLVHVLGEAGIEKERNRREQ